MGVEGRPKSITSTWISKNTVIVTNICSEKGLTNDPNTLVDINKGMSGSA